LRRYTTGEETTAGESFVEEEAMHAVKQLDKETKVAERNNETVVGLGHFSRYLAGSQNTQVMTAGMVHVTNLTPAGSKCNPIRWRPSAWRSWRLRRRYNRAGRSAATTRRGCTR
jgi:hypothetical protein